MKRQFRRSIKVLIVVLFNGTSVLGARPYAGATTAADIDITSPSPCMNTGAVKPGTIDGTQGGAPDTGALGNGSAASKPTSLPSPLNNLKIGGKQRTQIHAVSGGFVISNSADIRADVVMPADTFLCRLTPSKNDDVAQFSIGRVGSKLCSALFSPSADLGVSFEGREVVLTWDKNHYVLRAQGPLTVGMHPDFMKKERGIKWFKPLDRKAFPRAPAGWCTWYAYWQGIDEAETLKNTDWLAVNLKKFGCQYVQIDDGWQGIGHGNGENRDWYVTDKTKFPHEMGWLASAIRTKGFKPGLWLIPFATSSESTFRDHPEMFCKRADGTSVGETRDPKTGQVTYDWTGRYIVDSTSKEGQKWFRDLFGMIIDTWGYDYVKIDGQGGSRGLPEQVQDQLADPKMAPDEVYREGLSQIKSVMGPDRVLLNCGGQWDSCGYCDGIRIGGDVQPSWDGMQSAIHSTMESVWHNGLDFWTDPDVCCVRPPGNNGSSLTFDQAQVWATLLGITGQLLMASDKMYDLPEKNVELLRRIFPTADIRPMDLYSYGKPRVFDLKVAKPGMGDWDVVALFNWSSSGNAKIDLQPAVLGLPAGKYSYYDAWRKQLLAVSEAALPLSLDPTSCRLIVVRQYQAHPQLLGTSRHITQGADDLLQAKWDTAKASWSGKSAVVGGDPYELRFSLPPGWTCSGEGVRMDGPLAVLTIRRTENSDAAWAIRFLKTGAADAQAALKPVVQEAKAEPTEGGARLTWTGQAPLGFMIYRNGQPISQVEGSSFTDRALRRGATYRYEVSGFGWEGESAKAPAGEIVLQPAPRGTAPDAWVEDLPAVTATQDWGTLHKRTSVEGNPIKVGGKTYEHGLGTHANSEIQYLLGNRYARFEAEVGVDNEKGENGTVVFQLFADGTKVFDSGILRGDEPAKKVSVALGGVDELRLVVTDAGDGINSDHADWADARLIGNK